MCSWGFPVGLLMGIVFTCTLLLGKNQGVVFQPDVLSWTLQDRVAKGDMCFPLNRPSQAITSCFQSHGWISSLVRFSSSRGFGKATRGIFNRLVIANSLIKCQITLPTFSLDRPPGCLLIRAPRVMGPADLKAVWLQQFFLVSRKFVKDWMDKKDYWISWRVHFSVLCALFWLWAIQQLYKL